MNFTLANNSKPKDIPVTATPVPESAPTVVNPPESRSKPTPKSKATPKPESNPSKQTTCKQSLPSKSDVLGFACTACISHTTASLLVALIKLALLEVIISYLLVGTLVGCLVAIGMYANEQRWKGVIRVVAIGVGVLVSGLF